MGAEGAEEEGAEEEEEEEDEEGAEEEWDEKKEVEEEKEEEEKEEKEVECVNIRLAHYKDLQLHQQNGQSKHAIQQVQVPASNHVIAPVQASGGERHDMTQEIDRGPVLCVPVGSSAQLVKLRPRCMPSGNAYK